MKWIEIIPGLWRTDYDTTTKLNSVVVPLHGQEIRGDDVAKARGLVAARAADRARAPARAIP